MRKKILKSFLSICIVAVGASAETVNFQVTENPAGDRATGCRVFWSQTQTEPPFANAQNVACGEAFSLEVDRTKDFSAYGTAFNGSGESPYSEILNLPRLEQPPLSPTISTVGSTPTTTLPQNAQLLLAEDFTGGRVNDAELSEYIDATRLGNYSPFVTSPVKTTDAAFRYVVLAGQTSGISHGLGVRRGHWQAMTGEESSDEWYAEHWEYAEPGYIFANNSAGSTKMIRTQYEDPSTPSGSAKHHQLDFIFYGACGKPRIHFQRYDPFFEVAQTSPDCFPLGRWVKLGLWFKHSTPGESDGFIRAYIDDVQTLELANLMTRYSGDSNGTNQMTFVDTFSAGSGGTGPSADQMRYIDAIRLFDTKPA